MTTNRQRFAPPASPSSQRRLFHILTLLAALLLMPANLWADPVGYAILTDKNEDGTKETLTFKYGTKPSGDDVWETTNTGQYPGWMVSQTDIISVVFDSSFADARPQTCYAWFSFFQNLESIINIQYLNTSNVTNMYRMFTHCSKLTSLDLSSFNTSNVTNMSYMFYHCTSLTALNLSSFNTSNVTDMSYMFRDCYDLTTLNLSSFNTSNVTDMSNMFYCCNKLTTLDLRSFNTGKVTNMYAMFNNCRELTSLDLSHFDTGNVTNMSTMFDECWELTSLNLSNFNTNKLTNMSTMFDECRKLTSLDLSSFNTSNVTNMSNMFKNCYRLTEICIGSGFNTDKLTSSTSFYRMFYNTNELANVTLKGSSVPNITEDLFSTIPTAITPALVVKDMDNADSDMLNSQVSIDGDGYIIWKGGKFITLNGMKGPKVTVEMDDWAYDGSGGTHLPSLSGDNQEDFNPENVVYTYTSADKTYSSSTVPSQVGEYTVTAAIPSFTKDEVIYMAMNVTNSFSITQREAVLAWVNTSFTYNGTAWKPTATVSNIVAGDVCTVTVTGEQTNASTNSYTATATALSNSNYALPTTGVTQSFTINKKSVTVSDGITASNKVYDGTTSATVNTEGATFTGLIGGDALTVTATGTFDNANVGEGKTVAISGLTLGGTSVANYKLAESGHQASTTANITKKTLTVTADNTSRAYGAANPTFSVSYNGLVDGESASSLTTQPTASCTATATSSVGTYPITLGGGESTNYNFAYVEGELTVTPKELTVNWPETPLVYNGSAQAFVPTIDGIVNGDACNVTVRYERPYYDYTATAGTTGQTGTTITHYYQYLVDGVLSLPNVWCAFYPNKSNGVWYVEFNTAEPVTPISYTLITGADTQQFPDRNPMSWRFMAKQNTNDTWTEIAVVTNDSRLEAKDNEPYDYDLDVAGGTYQYFRFEVSARCGSDDPSFGPMQLADLHLNVSTSLAPQNVGTYTAHAVSLDNANYKLPATGSMQDFTITQQEVTLTWPETTTFSYDGTVKTCVPTIGGVYNTECSYVMSYDTEGQPYSGYTATAGTGGYQNLMDGNLSTKWEGTTSNRANGIWYVEFNTPEAICPIGYRLVTGDDTSSKSYMNPMFWKLKAKQSAGDDWTTIATVKDDNKLGAVNKQAYNYGLDVVGNTRTYQYYRLEISGAHKQSANSWNTGMQLQDFYLLVQGVAPKDVGNHTAYVALDNLNYKLPSTGASQTFTIDARSVSNATINFDSQTVDYTGSAVRPGVTVTDAGGVITADDYTVSIDDDGGINPGSYTVTITGQNNYSGTKQSATYKVVYPLTPAKAYTTYVSPFDLQMANGQSGLTAYTVQSITESQVVLQEETAVFKDVPMILIGTAETTYRLEKAEGKNISTTRSDKLKKGSVVCTGSANYYVLQNTGTGAEFVWASSGTVPEGKCYLDLTPDPPSGARNRSLTVVIGDGTTGLSEKGIVNSDKFATADWYSLDGRKLNGVPQKKGLYIHNGQKVVIK